jgi:NitT/TauT family transport system ATP-binding protein
MRNAKRDYAIEKRLPLDSATTATPAIPATAAISVQAVQMRYGRDGVLALADVTLDIAPGEFISLIGPSGCGKTTLLRLIGDLMQPTAGRIRVQGKSTGEARRNRDYGLVPQAPTLYDWRTVIKNVELPLEIMNVPAGERQSRAAALLGMVGLGDFASHYPWQLSGGMQQRVSIARALSFKPSILLMDEPFGALDEMTRERLNGELLNIWRETGTTIVFVTHSIPEAVFLSTRVVVMSPRPGKIEHIIPIDLPPVRDVETREDPHYFELISQVREHLREMH